MDEKNQVVHRTSTTLKKKTFVEAHTHNRKQKNRWRVLFWEKNPGCKKKTLAAQRGATQGGGAKGRGEKCGPDPLVQKPTLAEYPRVRVGVRRQRGGPGPPGRTSSAASGRPAGAQAAPTGAAPAAAPAPPGGTAGPPRRAGGAARGHCVAGQDLWELPSNWTAVQWFRTNEVGGH